MRSAMSSCPPLQHNSIQHFTKFTSQRDQPPTRSCCRRCAVSLKRCLQEAMSTSRTDLGLSSTLPPRYRQATANSCRGARAVQNKVCLGGAKQERATERKRGGR